MTMHGGSGRVLYRPLIHATTSVLLRLASGLKDSKQILVSIENPNLRGASIRCLYCLECSRIRVFFNSNCSIWNSTFPLSFLNPVEAVC
jgi:hypothetical protein